MTRETAPLFRPLLDAFIAGKTIQYYMDGLGWTDLHGSVKFTAPVSRYRVKPEPEEFFLVRATGVPRIFVYKNRSSAELCMRDIVVKRASNRTAEIIKVRSVLD